MICQSGRSLFVPDVVLVAIVGGPPGERTVDRAAALAKERGAALIIAHVVDPEFMQSHAHVPESTMQGLFRLGNLHLEKARARAERTGVSTEAVLREGPLLQELTELITENGVKALVVGAHKEHFLSEGYEADWATLKRQTGVEVIVVH